MSSSILPIKHISVSIQASPILVYGYAANPENLPNWASGLSQGIWKEEGVWYSDSPMGKVALRFAEANSFGVLDHWVTLPDGEEVLNPFRVLVNGEGSELVFTAYQREGMTAEEFDRDQALILADLLRLKALLEG